MDLSIIIPVFNGAATIGRCLDSIYAQGLDEKQYEVICVDDCSTALTSVAAIEDYKNDNAHPMNLILIRHEVNKRQGGARNTGIKAARSKWILFIDQDDFFIDNTLPKALCVARDYPEMDFIMFDCVYGNRKEWPKKGIYALLNQRVMTGAEFLQNQPVPWCPWCYMYQRNSILNSGLQFEEHVRFEDADFVLRFTAQAKQARFIPLVLVYHVVHKEEQSFIGNDKEKIRDLLKIEYRIAIAANQQQKEDWKTGQAMMNHAIVHRFAMLKHYLWRLRYRDVLALLYDNHYPAKTGNYLVDFSNNHIKLTAIALTLLKPLFHFAATIKKLTK